MLSYTLYLLLAEARLLPKLDGGDVGECLRFSQVCCEPRPRLPDGAAQIPLGAHARERSRPVTATAEHVGSRRGRTGACTRRSRRGTETGTSTRFLNYSTFYPGLQRR